MSRWRPWHSNCGTWRRLQLQTQRPLMLPLRSMEVHDGNTLEPVATQKMQSSDAILCRWFSGHVHDTVVAIAAVVARPKIFSTSVK